MNFGSTQANTFNPIITVSANKTLGFSDLGTFQNCTNTAAITITVNNDANLNLPIGSEITINQDSTGSVTLAATTPAVIRRLVLTATTGHILVGQYSLVIIKKVAANEWRVYGGITW